MLKIAIVAGGDSGEYEISMKSGLQVQSNIDRTKFDPYLVEIRGAKWNVIIDTRKIPIDKNQFTLLNDGETIHFDAVFNAIHGSPGENGKLQGYFDMLGIPYTSSDLTTSALTFNKSFCKNVVSHLGINTARSIHLFYNQHPSPEDILKELSLPLFVKPNNGGSSVGMSKVNRQEELENAVIKAFYEDNEVIVEEFVPGRELTCGVILSGGLIIPFPVTEIISKKEYFDYEAKYHEGLSEEVVPADIPAANAVQCQNISKLLFAKLNCRGVVRFDYILHGNILFFLEVNTVPGLTAQSIVPKMAAAHGWTMTELITRLIDGSLAG
ncbi:MAG: D-alanine--D-alanine ligase [Bacteroidetes bacterium]|nr:D-alanine--D-alanine ligase [Bacteroidota bacterium]